MQLASHKDFFIILIFLGVLAFVFSFAGFSLYRYIAQGKSQSKRRFGLFEFSGGAAVLLSIIGIICAGYAYFVEPNWLEITHVRLPIRGLTKTVRFVQISDMHCDATPRLENQIAQEIKRLRPSIIIFTGDGVNSLDGIPIFNAFVHKLKQVAPTYAVKGDWDFAFDPVDILAPSGLTVLAGSTVVIIDGVKLCLVGTDSGASCRASLNTAPKGLPTIMLYHNPDGDVVLDGDTDQIDLYLCGHTHGGQIALPFYGALITQSVQGKKYESGLHQFGKTWLYTNRGIGMEGHFPRMRFCARPELTVFELYPG